MKHIANVFCKQAISALFNQKQKNGEVGIEVEVEGTRLPVQMQYWWTVHQDGSLRAKGPDGQAVEYVLKTPIKRENVAKALDYLSKQFNDAASNINPKSPRTSVHVHLNVQDWTLVRAMNLAVLWYVLEGPLVAWCGPERVANLFCLRAEDAEGQITSIKTGLQTGQYGIFNGDSARYAALNLQAIGKFGSVEFRTLNGTTDPGRIQAWVEILLALKDYAAGLETPRQIIEEFSLYGPTGFVNRVFKEGWPCGLFAQWDESWEAMRLAQEVAFAVDWSPSKVEVKQKLFVAQDIGTDHWTRPPPMPVPEAQDVTTRFFQAAVGQLQENAVRRQNPFVGRTPNTIRGTEDEVG